MPKKVLVVEDDPDIVKLLKFHLEAEGFRVLIAEDGEAGLKTSRDELPALILLDLMLPKMSGLDLCRILKGDKKTEAIPIIMVTAKGEEVDRVVGFELGADDYVAKPFSPREVLLRVKAVLKRTDTAAQAEGKEIIEVGDLSIHIPRHEVKIKDKKLVLTKTEFNLLITLVQNKGRVQTRDKLLENVWGYDAEVDTRTIDTHMRRLREKMGSLAERFETIRGVGYRFLEE